MDSGYQEVVTLLSISMVRAALMKSGVSGIKAIVSDILCFLQLQVISTTSVN
jgi:hypothetical protein